MVTGHSTAPFHGLFGTITGQRLFLPVHGSGTLPYRFVGSYRINAETLEKQLAAFFSGRLEYPGRVQRGLVLQHGCCHHCLSLPQFLLLPSHGMGEVLVTIMVPKPTAPGARFNISVGWIWSMGHWLPPSFIFSCYCWSWKVGIKGCYSYSRIWKERSVISLFRYTQIH